MRKFLTGILLFVLLFAQFTSISHALEHEFDDDHKSLPQHECIVCHGDANTLLVENEVGFDTLSVYEGSLFIVDVDHIIVSNIYKPYLGHSPPLNLVS